MNESTGTGERVVAVHAHPDDETLTMGGTLARLGAGGSVVLVTATRGELGEVIPPELAALEGSAELGPFRVGELDAAMAALGVDDHRFLGAIGARSAGAAERIYRDSGMQWAHDPRTGARHPEPLQPIASDSLCAAPLEEAVADLIEVLEDVEASSVISYDAGGGYGHPDHIRTAQIAATAAALLRLPYFEIVPVTDAGAEDDIVVDLNDGEFERKRAALLAHRTQIGVDGDSSRLSSGDPSPIPRTERFRAVPIAVPEPDIEQDPPTLGTRVVSGVLSVAIGALVGVITTVAHQSTWTLGSVTLPLGLAASIVAVLGVLLGLRLVMYDRFVAFCTAMGLLAAIGVLALRSTGGSVLVPANTSGVVWTFGPALIALVVIAWPRVRAPQRRHADPSGSDAVR